MTSKSARAYKHRVYVQRYYQGDTPATYWNAPEEYIKNPSDYVTYVMQFHEFVDRTKEHTYELYAVVDNGVVQRLSYKFPTANPANVVQLAINAPATVSNRKDPLTNKIEQVQRYLDSLMRKRDAVNSPKEVYPTQAKPAETNSASAE